jgi:hypothetical protein
VEFRPGPLPGTVVMVQVPAGLDDNRSQAWTLDSEGIVDAADPADAFGSSLAAGDFDRDGRADLAIGIPLKGRRTAPESGAVTVIRGGANGLTSAGDQFWHQDR